jgi:hypothetical protein
VSVTGKNGASKGLVIWMREHGQNHSRTLISSNHEGDEKKVVQEVRHASFVLLANQAFQLREFFAWPIDHQDGVNSPQHLFEIHNSAIVTIR